MAIIGSHLVLDCFFNGFGQVVLLPDCFSKLFVRASGYESLGCSGALTSVLSSYARTEEDIIKGFPGGGGERREERMHLGSRPLCRGQLAQLRHAPDAPTFIWVWRGGGHG